MNRPTTLAFVIAGCSLLAAVLWLDGPGGWNQALLGGTVWLLLLAAFVRHRELVAETLIAIFLASSGEVLLSIGIGVYHYRTAIIPMYVPPGHGVVYLLALQSSRQIRKYERIIIASALGAGTIMAAIAAIYFGDTFGLACWIVTMMIASISERRLLIATCVVFTTVLEVAGTWAGNWTWHKTQGILTSGNPPVGVVMLYCCIDLVTLMLLNAWTSRRQNAACESPTPVDVPSLSMESPAA